MVREALFLASPSLDSAIDAWLENPDAPRARDVEAIASRYIARMAARPTPFGLFAACTAAAIGDTSSFVLGSTDECIRRSRLDMHYLGALGETLETDRHVRDVLRFRRNSSISSNGDELRYVEGHTGARERARDFRLVSVDPTAPLMTAITETTDPMTIHEVRDAIVHHHPRLSPTASARFVHDLIDAQILESDLRPAVTCDDPISRFTQTLGTSENTRSVVACLTGVQRGLHELDSKGLGIGRESYHAILSALERLPIPVDPARVFQVDLFRPSRQLRIGEGIIRSIREAVALLHRITPVRGTAAMARFREKFAERYGDREIPLVEALDEERGLGFDASNATAVDPSPLLAGIEFPSVPDETSVSAQDRYKLQRLLALRESAQSEWALDENDLEALTVADPAPLPDAIAAMVTLASRSNDALDRGDFDLLVHNVSGPSGVALLARFCHGDPAIRSLVDSNLRAEEACLPDSIFAEIVHLPAGRLGNVICRPVLRVHEIPYLGSSGVPSDRQIALDDLRVSIRGREVRLRSGKLDREVIPRLSNAHAYWRSTLSIYRFLGALQQEGRACPLRWSWGNLLQDAPFLPRVKHRNIVLSLAQWTIPAKDVGLIGHDPAVRSGRGLPRWVCVAEGDNILPIDLESSSAGIQLSALARRREHLRLQELFPEPDRMCMTSEAGAHTHELVVPFARAAAPPARSRPLPYLSERSRAFTPASEWLYAKIYTGPATSDRILRTAIAPLVRELKDDKCIDRWFFIRYTDPEPHLRIRFRGAPDGLLRDVLPRLRERIAPFLDSGRIARFQLDTYEPEVERYGGPRAMSISEQVFATDSDAALAIIERTTGDAGAETRWLAAFYGMHTLVTDAGFDDGARVDFVTRCRDAFALEYRLDVMARRSLGARYRAVRPRIEQLLRGTIDSDEALDPMLSVFRARSVALAGSFAELRGLRDRGELLTSWDALVGSFVHMHVNRVIREYQRKHELVLYEFLVRAYSSIAARTASTPASGIAPGARQRNGNGLF
ncbi:lantibiotic dehydratase [Pendulispora rubella]|uniref:Lantibiotic dehydratase n=2 Tax=Pendulispora rubella TaxID=2741070 RepID=A0ABZ2LIM4_9BACT